MIRMGIAALVILVSVWSGWYMGQQQQAVRCIVPIGEDEV